ncbi:MAG: hypothetical protein AAF639_00290 [Chloroflexota bacterium]
MSDKNRQDDRVGVDAFVAHVRQRADVLYQDTEHHPNRQVTRQFILDMARDYANIKLNDLKTPIKFYKQISESPPIRFGLQGFRADILDDYNPARHYTAFVFAGYFMPTPLALLSLYAWEALGFIRYRGHWSVPDILSGKIGIQHGRAVRREGGRVLPALIERDLKDVGV